jgi:competence protein ComEC
MRPTFAAIGLFLVAALLGAQRYTARYLRRDLRITFFDVGQGDGILVEFPGSETWLVDAGGGFGDWNIGARELVPELARLGILHLQTALLTHPDADHAYGFRGILSELTVDELWMSRAVRSSGNRLAGELLALAASRNTAVRVFSRPEERVVAGVRVRLFPMDAGRDTNDEALLARLQYGACSALLAADAELISENALLALHPGHADLLKVAHHGSRTSSSPAFLEAVRPRWAVISVGLHNRYRHPADSVIRRLRRAGAVVFRTDYHGFVRFRFGADGLAHCDSAQGSCGTAACHSSP